MDADPALPSEKRRAPQGRASPRRELGSWGLPLGGGAPIPFSPDGLGVKLDPALDPRQRANELVLRLCCVGEAFSFPMLAAGLEGVRHALVREVLERVVRDEALH